ncbi:phosphonate metabolism protein/1,5-bisphosphokinase (PRPP-forming) PhnN [Halodesulfovibrio marinisediminis]|uniref:ribose 1,5-bisphosphate phosphokinase n=1 Tax=Halodesulfovibrio marinisediminis DSM 17456 TaxID=1121457 RepID=A0A1N6DWG8_9BACT|nr:phosphonate metabolism protein/1,5-bisphosphokinase (PRPP-forming) PhnN [Halodesulfovibrio marinisediminis]SIN75044.1 ribose 1,5-bisphosphokinase [Halodesulfovibrio marinisediminis DSM 17456]
MKGTLFYLMGPSGVGKDTLLNTLRSRLEGKSVIVAHRYITRPASATGENHVALSKKEFQKHLVANSFALHWHSHDKNYGIGIEINNWLNQGLSVVINGSRAYLPQARELYPDLQPVLITAPENIIAERLHARQRETKNEILHRLHRNTELNDICTIDCGCGRQTAVVINDSTIESAVDHLEALICNEELLLQHG